MRARAALRLLSTLCLVAGIALLLSPVAWVAYTAGAVGPAQTAALAAWEEAARSPGQGAAEIRPPSGLVLSIPRLNLRRFVPEGATAAHLRQYGVGRITWTALPDAPGIVGIGGHRTTYGAPFFRLDRLQPGDVILLDYGGRRYEYAVAGAQVVRPEQVEILQGPAGMRGIALVTCTPAYSAAYRLVVLGALRGVTAAVASR